MLIRVERLDCGSDSRTSSSRYIQTPCDKPNWLKLIDCIEKENNKTRKEKGMGKDGIQKGAFTPQTIIS